MMDPLAATRGVKEDGVENRPEHLLCVNLLSSSTT